MEEKNMDHGKLANSLWEAEQNHVQIGRLTDLYPEMSVEDAWANLLSGRGWQSGL